MSALSRESSGRTPLLLGLNVYLIAGLLGCGGSTATTPTPIATPVPCTQLVMQEGSGLVEAHRAPADEFWLFKTIGRLDVIVDWTYPDSEIGVYLIPAGSGTVGTIDVHALDCFSTLSCNFVLRSDPGGPKPRKLSAYNVGPGGYFLVIANFSSRNEAESDQIVQSTQTCPPLAGQIDVNAWKGATSATGSRPRAR